MLCARGRLSHACRAALCKLCYLCEVQYPLSGPNDRAGMPLLPAQAEKQREKAQHYKQVRACGDGWCPFLGGQRAAGADGRVMQPALHWELLVRLSIFAPWRPQLACARTQGAAPAAVRADPG